MTQILLSNGMASQVEEEDYLHFNQWNYYAQVGNNTIYAMRYIDSTRVREYFLLHCEIIIRKGININGLLIDHKDGNGLNNLHNNLRIATKSQNMSNRGKNKNNTSGYKGVYWDESRRKWKASIKYKYESINLGSYDLDISAAIAYNHQARMLFGEFAWLNDV